MKIKSGFVVREVAGNSIVVPVGDKTVDFNGIMTLNETGRFLWDMLEKGSEKRALIAALTTEYNVDKATAEADVEEFISLLVEANLAE